MDIKNRKEPVEIFCCYAHEDQILLIDLKKHLKPWEHKNLITIWTDMSINPGADREKESVQHLNKAQIILLLISKDFIQSKYYDGTEMKLAMEKYERGEVHIIPILLNYCAWEATPFGQLQVLPTGAKPITGSEWHNQDEAFADVIQGILRVVEELTQQNEDFGTSYWFSTERLQLVDLYLKSVAATTKQLPWGYLPGDFTSEVGIEDVYIPPHLSSKEYRRVSVEDEWLEREIIRQGNQEQEKEKNKRRSVMKAEKPSSSSIYEIIQSGANATLLGYMGSGKSMAASYIALQLAKGEGQSIFGLAKPKIPILLRLGRMREASASDLLTFAIESAVAHLDHATTLKDILRQEWNTGNALLILDALDESGGKLEGILGGIAHLGDRNLHKSSVLLTSRPNAYSPVGLAGFKAFTLEELQEGEMFEFIETWTKVLFKGTGRTDREARDRARSLISEINKRPPVQVIASNQLLLTILIILSLHERKFRLDRVTEAGLLNTYVINLIERERSKGVEVPIKYDTDLLRIVFAYTGFEVQRAQSGMFGGICTYTSLLRLLSGSRHLSGRDNPSGTAEAILKFWLATGLIQQTDDVVQGMRFRHQAFQYLGAAIAMTYQSEERLANILDDVEANPEWADVRRLYFGLKSHPQSLLE